MLLPFSIRSVGVNNTGNAAVVISNRIAEK